jgi:D-alanyl-D-alanine carboxypeptidase
LKNHRFCRDFATASVLAALLLPLPSAAGDAPTAPVVPAELRALAEAFVAQVADGDAQAFERFAQQNFSAGALSRRNAEDRSQLLARLHGDFGDARLVTITSTGPWAADATVRAATGITGIFSLQFEADPPHRITGIGISVRDGGGAAPRTEHPPLPNLGSARDSASLAVALDPYMTRFAESGQFSGNLLVAKDGQAMYSRAYGMADAASSVANAEDTRFNLASIGKQFTKVAIGQLLAQGKLALTDTLGKHLPHYPQEAARQATLQQLLEHRVGIVDIFDVEPKTPPRHNREWFELVAPRPLAFAPGAEKRYCNGCYVVLGEVIAAVSGLAYEDYLARHIFAPAGMSATAFRAASERSPDQAVMYTRKPDGLEPTSLGPGGRGSAAGGVFATAADLLAFDNALRGYRLLDRARTEWMLGSGDEIAPGRAAGEVAAAGGTDGANALLESDGRWTVVVLTNRDPRTGEDFGLALMQALPR